jgi:hypothetical protein
MRRAYGNSGVDIYDQHQISSTDVKFIKDHIIPLPLKIPPVPDLTNQTVYDLCMHYMRRTYGEKKASELLESRQFTPIDVKMMHTICALNSSYKKHKTSLHNPILINVYPVTLEKKTIVTTAPMPESVRCKALKMDGNPCNAKIKENNEFCLRHMKKK